MTISLYTTNTDRRYLYKQLGNGVTMTGTLKEQSNVIRPTITIEIENPTGYNYAYIEDFGRWYYISEITNLRTNLWRLSLACDVLASYAAQIRNCKVSLAHSEEKDTDPYLSGSIYRATVKQVTDIINFSGGLLENGEYILITAGGIA